MKKSQLRSSLLAVSALSVSIASQLHGAVFDSNVPAGNWSDPTSWLVGGLPTALFPNTYTGDTAHIVGGSIIDFNAINANPDGPLTTPATRIATLLNPTLNALPNFPVNLGVGSLVVKNGGLIDVDGVGSTFTQSINNEIRIGDGGGAGTGGGTLTIRNGGLFSSGDAAASGGAIGVVVGGNLNTGGSGGGNGTVNINGGTFVMGDGLTLNTDAFPIVGTPILGVGIEGSTGVINVGDGSLTGTDATLNLKLNNNRMEIGSTNGLGSTAGTGTVIINVDGAVTQGTGAIIVGNSRASLTDFGNGTLTISGGKLGQGAATTGELRVGSNGGVGTLTMTTGVVDTRGEFNIGRGAGFGTPSVGVVTLGAFGATDSFNVGPTSVGRGGGTGTWNLNGAITAATVNGDLWVGRDAGSVGTLNISAATVNTTGFTKIGADGATGTLNLASGLNSALYLTIGQDGGIGTVNQTAGTVTFTQWAAIGVGAGPAGSKWNISGGNITSGSGLEVGSDRARDIPNPLLRGGEMNISGTANVSVGSLAVGIRSGSDGLLNITGGTVVTNNLGIAGAQAGNAKGEANISGAANVTINPGGGQSYIGNNGGSVGTLNITGVTVNNVSGQDWQIGFNGGTGNLNILNSGPTGGVVKHNWWLNIARGGSSVGNVTVDGAGSAVILDGNPGPGGGGDINWNVGEDGTGTMTVKNGASVDHDNAQSYRSHVGRNNGSHGFLNVESGATVAVTELFAGSSGGATGEININTGGTVTVQNWMAVGTGGGSTGTVNIDGPGSKLVHQSTLYGRNGGGGGDNQVGYQGGTGTINVTNGGRLELGWWLNIGRDAASTGTVNADGPASRVIVGTGQDAKTNIGEQGTGTVNLSNGAQLISNSVAPGTGGRELYVGRETGSHGFLNVRSGAEVHADGNWSMIIGQNGTGTTTVDTGGKILANNWVVIGNEAPSVGTLNIADAGSLVESGTPGGGSHEGRFITGRLGRATVNQTGGTVRADNWFAIGIDPGGNGTYNFDGGNIELKQPNFGDRNVIVANRGTGSLNITNGNVAGTTISDGAGGRINQFNVGADSGGVGTLNINLTDPAGKIVSRELYAGWQNGSNGTINILKGTLQTDEWVEIGRGQNGQMGTGTVNVDGAQAVWDRGITANSRQDIQFGQGEADTTSKGYLNVRNGGTVKHNWWINLGRQHLDEGHITIDGAGSSINIVPAVGQDHNAQINIGENGTGTLDITNGGKLNHMIEAVVGGGGAAGGGEFYIARNDNAKGTVTVDGAGSQLNVNSREFRIASNNGGVGTLNITNGGQVNFSSHRENFTQADGNFGLAENNGSTARINMNGGQLNVTAWSLFSAWNQAATNARIDMLNSVINIKDTQYLDGNGNPGNGGHLFWGDAGTAVINQDGGSINAQGWSAIGRERGGNATYNLGVGATPGSVANMGGSFTVGGLGGNELYVGRQSHGTINMGAGTSITVANAIVLGQETSPTTPSTGTINNNGGTIFAGGDFRQGGNTAGVLGTYNQSAGSAVTVNGEWQVGNGLATGVANINGGTVLAQSWVAIGRDGGTGTLNLTGGTITKGNTGPNNPGTFDIGTFGNGATPGTGTLNQSGTGVIINTVTDTNIGRDGNSVGVWNLSGGAATLANLVIGRDGGSNGTLNQTGGLLSVNGISSGGGTAALNLGPGTVAARQDNGSFISGFTNSGGHSAINLTGTGPTIDSNGHRVRITAGNVIGGLDANPSDGLLGTALTITGDATPFNDTDKVTLQVPVGTGNLSVHILSGGFLDSEVDQTLDALVIESGGYFELSDLNSPPGAPPLAAPAFDPAAGASLAASPVQGVPEPGSISLILLSALGLLGRRNRGKRA